MSIKRFANTTSVLSILLLLNSSWAQQPKSKFYGGGVSDRDLLRLGDPRLRAAALAKGPSLVETSVDTIRILAIRVDFQEDNNTLTTGNGKFDLSASFDGVIDPPPHDRAYFADQLTALSNYFRKVSRGKLIIEAEVYPQDPQSSYTLSEQMSSYVPVGSETALDQRLSELFQEGFQLADADAQIDFSRFESFVVFHAGVGADFALDFDPTPQDIPSVFLDFKTLREFLGGGDSNYRGISVNGGNAFIRDGLVLPETQSQEGFEIALLGTMAIQFGHQLGLPNLFNTTNGRPGIGIFGLMDQGSGNFIGLLPAEPCAWSKLFLGWETPIEVRNGQDLMVAASQASDPNKIYKIPISSREYFLVENRHRDFSNDNIAIGRDSRGTRIEFRWDDQGQRLVAESAIGVITEVNEYDFGLPGSGILIWHVDEQIIADNIEENLVNADPLRRGVDLEEADGAQDIGQFYGFLSAGAGSENGVIEDMFWGSNPINMLVNSATQVTFTPTTTPNSQANSGANSHTFITEFSEPADVMTFSVRQGFSMAGFPQFLGQAGSLTNAPAVVDLDQDGFKEIIWSSNLNSTLLALNADGSKFIANEDSIQVQQLNGTSKNFPLAVFAEPEGSHAFPPVVTRLNGADLVVVVATDRVVAAYFPEDLNTDGRADALFVRPQAADLTTPPMVAFTFPPQVVVGTEDGAILSFTLDSQTTVGSVASGAIVGLAVLSSNAIAFTSADGTIGAIELAGSLLWQNDLSGPTNIAPVVADLDRNGRLDVLTITEEGELFVFSEEGASVPGFPRNLGVSSPSHLALGDIDDDGFHEIVFVAGNDLYALNHVGALENNFPIKLGGENSTEATSSPVLADLDGDNVPEIIVGTASGQLVAVNFLGNQIAGFPLTTGSAVRSSPVMSDVDGDRDLDLLAVASDGFIYAYDLANTELPETVVWGTFLRDGEHSNADLALRNAPAPSGQLMPANLVYNYPNPTEGNRTTIRYLLNFQADVQIRIYDLAGDLVDEFAGPGFGQAENEVDWALDAIESGVYLARVEARADNASDVVIFKIAVVK